MSDNKDTRTILDKSRDIISQLREMEHYSQDNIEKLSEFWFQLDDDLKLDSQADAVNELLKLQNAFQEKISSTISDYEIECNRIENEET